jgi:hypothetical protein
MAPEPDADQALFEAGLWRIALATMAIAAAGGLALLIWKGWRWAVPFLLGAAASYLNFRWLKRVVDALGGALSASPSPKFAMPPVRPGEYPFADGIGITEGGGEQLRQPACRDPVAARLAIPCFRRKNRRKLPESSRCTLLEDFVRQP